jgi:hypothetical protein
MNCQRNCELLTHMLGADHVGGNVQDSPILRNLQSNHIGILHASETLCEQFPVPFGEICANPGDNYRGLLERAPS